jgi:hypothetical protein
MDRRKIVMVLAALLVATGLWCLVPQRSTGVTVASAAAPAAVPAVLPVAPGPAPGPAPTVAGTRQPWPATPHSMCRVGEPRRLLVPALGVDAAFERIGLDRRGTRDASGRLPLGNPSDRTRAGWYAEGPRPGSGRGTVLTNGHTYRNGSAIFREDFARRVALGQVIEIRQDNGSLCSYRITQVWREIDAARDYPELVVSQHLYDFSGPERLLLATCGGRWDDDADTYEDITVLLAAPVASR